MFWGCFSYHGVGEIVFIDSIMNGEMYKNILNENLFQYAKNFKMNNNFIF